MLRRMTVITVCFVFLSGLIAGARTAQAKDETAKRKEHEQATERTLTELNRKMDELAAGFRMAEGQTRSELNRLYDEFKKEQVVAHKDLEEMRKATNEKWDELRIKMNKNIKELNGLYERARSRGEEKNRPTRPEQ